MRKEPNGTGNCGHGEPVWMDMRKKQEKIMKKMDNFRLTEWLVGANLLVG